MMGNKRPLEAIDANARSSNSSGDSKTIARASKRPKSTHKSVEAALARARDVCTTMLPSADARRKTIDLSIFAKGTVERIHHNAANETVTCFLLSDNAPSVPYAELPVVFKGPWVNAHLNHGVLSENTSIVLAFKEARIGYGQTEQGPSDNNQAPFGVYLLFDRGVEFWITSEPLCIATGITASAASDWKHFKLFAQAQQTKTNAPLPRSDNERLAGEVVDEGPLASSVLTKSSEAIMQIQPAQIPAAAQQTEFQEQNTEEEECLPSPPTGITQIEAGSPSRATNVEVEDEGDAALAVMKNAKGLEYGTVSQTREPGPAHRDVNVIGVAINDSDRTFETAGGSNVTIRLVDPSSDTPSADEWQSGTWLGVTYLNSSKEHFPDVQKGDVLLIRSAKTVPYKTYTRLSVFSDQVCDWVCLPADVVRGLPEAALFNPIHANAFRTCPGAERPDDLERKHMQRLALWSREQIISSSLRSGPAVTRPGEDSIQINCSAANGLYDSSRVQLFSDLRAPSKHTESGPCEIVCRVIGQPWQGIDYIAMYATDYTSNPSSTMESGFVDGNRVLRADMIFKILLWQNDASEETIEKALESVKTGNALHFKGLRIRQAGGALHANGRLNKAEFEIVALREEEALSVALAQREKDYIDKMQVKAEPATVAALTSEIMHGRSVTTFIAPSTSNQIDNVTRLAHLKAPVDLRDPTAYFDCVCEIVADVYSNEMHGMTVIYVTDFTSNELFWQNANHSDYPRSRIIMQIAIFGDRQRDKVAFLKQGDRVFLTNVRCKLDKQGNLEGHVGERNMFRVEKLTKADEGYRLLEVSRQKCLGGEVAAGDEAPDPAPYIGPSKTSDDVVCKFAGHSVDDGILQPLPLDSEKVYRVRGRVIDYSPRDFDAFLVSKCNTCQRHLTRDERLCRVCEDGILGNAITRQWCFSLRIELEPSSCNIEHDTIEPKRAFWIVVIEGEGETVFMNGLQPVEDSIGEARRLLTRIVDNPSEGNRTNPIFDFCVKKTAGQRILLLCDTALRRKNVRLPWI